MRNSDPVYAITGEDAQPRKAFMVSIHDAHHRQIFAAQEALDFHPEAFYSVLTNGHAKRLDTR